MTAPTRDALLRHVRETWSFARTIGDHPDRLTAAAVLGDVLAHAYLEMLDTARDHAAYAGPPAGRAMFGRALRLQQYRQRRALLAWERRTELEAESVRDFPAIAVAPRLTRPRKPHGEN